MLHTLHALALSLLVNYGMWVLAAAVFVATLKWLSLNRKDISLVKGVLIATEALLGYKLGTKGDAVIRIWLDALDLVTNKPLLTWDEMLDEFVQFIKISMLAKNVTLTPVELNSVRETARVTMKMLSTDTTIQSKNRAVKFMMASEDN